MQVKFLVLLLFLLSNRQIETGAEGTNNKIIIKYFHQVNVEGENYYIEKNNFYEKISLIGLISTE